MPFHRQPPTAADLGLMQGSRPSPERLVTLANWQDPPFNRWAFQHFRELVPTAPIPRGDGPVADLPHALRDIDGLRFTSADGGTTTIASMLAATYTDAFLVLHRGAIVAEQYFNGMTPATLHLLQSVSKSITGTVAGILIDRGLLDPARPVNDYVSDLVGTSFRRYPAPGAGHAHRDEVLGGVHRSQGRGQAVRAGHRLATADRPPAGRRPLGLHLHLE